MGRSAGNFDLRFASDSNPGKFGSGVGVRKAAADRSTIADLVVRHMANCFYEERMGAEQFRIAFDTRQRARAPSE